MRVDDWAKLAEELTKEGKVKRLSLENMTITPAVAKAMMGVEEVELGSGVEVVDWGTLAEDLAKAREERGGAFRLMKLVMSDETGLDNFLSEKYGWTKGVPGGK